MSTQTKTKHFYEEYDPNTDYVTLHLDWVKKHKSFKPKGGLPIAPGEHKSKFNTYLEYLEYMYRECYKQHKTAYTLLKMDTEFFKVDEDIDDKVAAVLGEVPTEKYFVTFNYNDDNFDLGKIMPALKRLFKKTYIIQAEAVFEYHGKNNNHPHIHCIFEIKGPDRTPGRFKKTLKTTQLYSLLNADNFLDIKKYDANRHEDYLEGNKRGSKLLNVEKDKAWRDELGLLHLYTKENI